HLLHNGARKESLQLAASHELRDLFLDSRFKPPIELGETPLLLAPPKQGSNARQQLALVEWFREVVIRAGLQALDARLSARTRREEDERHVTERFVVAQCTKQVTSAHVRHHLIREHEVRPVPPRVLEPLVTIGREKDVVRPGQEIT